MIAVHRILSILCLVFACIGWYIGKEDVADKLIILFFIFDMKADIEEISK